MYNFRELNNTDDYKIYSNLLNQLSECNINKSQFQSFINNLDDNHIVIIVYSTLDNYIVGSGTLTIENKLIHNCGKVGHIEDIIIDTLSFVAIKDSLYPKSNRYQTMMNIPNSEAQCELRAGKLDRNGTIYSVFEARASKDIILAGLNPDLISQEKQVNSVDGVNGPYLKVGAMDEVNTSGNWPKLYDTAKDQ